MARIDRSIRISLRDLSSLIAAVRTAGVEVTENEVESLWVGNNGHAHLHCSDINRYFVLSRPVVSVGDLRKVATSMRAQGWTSATLWETGMNGRQVIDRAAA